MGYLRVKAAGAGASGRRIQASPAAASIQEAAARAVRPGREHLVLMTEKVRETYRVSYWVGPRLVLGWAMSQTCPRRVPPYPCNFFLIINRNSWDTA